MLKTLDIFSVKPLYEVKFISPHVDGLFLNTWTISISNDLGISMSGNFAVKCRDARPRKYSSTQFYGPRFMSSYRSHPGFIDLDGYSQQEMSYTCHCSDQAISYNPVCGPRQQTQTDSPYTPLRSFDELQTERSYLLNSLQREDYKATELLKKIRDLQEGFQGVVEGPICRNLKKKLGYLKSRMSQCTKQEKMILARLGQVTYEIQSKERWNRIEYERLQRWNCHGLHQMHLDATCPEFTPQNVYSHQWPVQPMCDTRYYREYSQSMPAYGDAPEWRATRYFPEPNEQSGLPCVVSTPTTARFRSASMTNLTAPVEKQKRLSMPELSIISN